MSPVPSEDPEVKKDITVNHIVVKKRKEPHKSTNINLFSQCSLKIGSCLDAESKDNTTAKKSQKIK